MTTLGAEFCTTHRPDGARHFSSSSSSSKENRLILEAQQGNLDAFNQLVLVYQDAVYRQAFWMLHEAEAAEDAAQEAFILAYRKLYTFHGGSFRAWVLKITSNYCLDMIRYAKNHSTQPLDQFSPDGEEIEPRWTEESADNPEQAVERAEMEQRIARAIQRLTPVYKNVLILVDLQELDYAEASSVLKIPMGTIKSRLARARRILRQTLCTSSERVAEYAL